jgi:hypothetical protein
MSVICSIVSGIRLSLLKGHWAFFRIISSFSVQNFLLFQKICIFAGSENKRHIFCDQKRWSCGRVARLSSAKAATAVRIRSGPR